MAQRVDFYSLQTDNTGEIVEKLDRSYIKVGDHVEVLGTGERVDEPYETIDGVVHDPNKDPDDYLEYLCIYYHGTYSWAGYAYDDTLKS